MFELWAIMFTSTAMLIVVLVTTFAAATMRAFAGFGGGLLMAPVLALYLPPQDVVVIVILLNFGTTLQLLPGMWKDIDWPLIWRMIPPAFAGIPLGAFVLDWLDPTILRRVVALIVTLLAIIMLTGWYYKGPRGRLQDWIAGVASGMLTSIAGIGGPPFVLYMLSAQSFSPVAFRVFFTVFFAFTQAIALAVLFMRGGMAPMQLAYVGTLMPLYLLATALGSYLFVKALNTRAHQIKRISLWLLLAVGVITFVL